MSRSTAPIEYFADESDYVRCRSRRTLETTEDDDPSEDRDATTDRFPTRSTTPASDPPPQLARRPRVRVTARKSVPLPIRRTFTFPHRDEAGPSRPRDLMQI